MDCNLVFLNARAASRAGNNQQTAIASILKDFDPQKLLSDDAEKITTSFKKLGIYPGPELEAAMASMGFDVRKVGDLAFGRTQQANNNNGQGKAASAIRSSLTEFKDLMAAATDSAGDTTKAISA